MADAWPKQHVARLHGWAVAREAARRFGLDFAAETRMARELEKVSLTFDVQEDGSVSMATFTGPRVLPAGPVPEHVHVCPACMARDRVATVETAHAEVAQVFLEMASYRMGEKR